MPKISIHPETINIAKEFKIDQNRSLGFGRIMSPVMVVCSWKKNQWGELQVVPYAPIPLDPCSKVLHYGQEIFEGLKAFKHPDHTLAIFRPQLNSIRFNYSARRMCMPELPEELFLLAVESITALSKNFIPSQPGSSLYIRPFMFASEVGLGIKPSNEFQFMVVATPSENYFESNSVRVFVERDDVRATPGGIGSAKTGGNYAASLESYRRAQEQGCDQTLWLDSIHKKYVEEMSGMNFLALMDHELRTPPLSDTILDGITRKTILTLFANSGFKVKEERMDIDYLLKAVENQSCTEAFICGTASLIVPISSFKDKDGKVYSLKYPEGMMSKTLKETFINIQSGEIEPPEPWLHRVNHTYF